MSNINELFTNVRIVTEQGTPTVEFKTYMDQILARIGGVRGGSYAALEFNAAVVWDVDTSPVAFLILTGNTTVTTVNRVAGDRNLYRLTLIQDATGGRTVTWGSEFRFPNGTPPAVTSGANTVTELWFSTDGTFLKLGGGAANLL